MPAVHIRRSEARRRSPALAIYSRIRYRLQMLLEIFGYIYMQNSKEKESNGFLLLLTNKDTIMGQSNRMRYFKICKNNINPTTTFYNDKFII